MSRAPVVPQQPASWLYELPDELLLRLMERVADLRSTNRANRAHWQRVQLQRLLLVKPSLAAAAAAGVPVHQLLHFLQPPPTAAGQQFWAPRQGGAAHPDCRLNFADPLGRIELHVLGPDDADETILGRIVRASRNPFFAVFALQSGDLISIMYGEDWVLEENYMGLPDGEFATYQLGDERAVHIAQFGEDTAYVLTDAGRLWVLPHWQHPPLDDEPPPPGVQGRPPLATPVSQLGSGESAPRFVLFDVGNTYQEDESGDWTLDVCLCAADAEGRLYAAGYPLGCQLLQRLTAPPVPVRSLLACANGLGPLALLVDGTVWQMASAQRLPLVSGVTAICAMDLPRDSVITTDTGRAPVGAVQFTGPGRPRLVVLPSVLADIRDWMQNEVAPSEDEDGSPTSYGRDGEDGDAGDRRLRARHLQHAAAVRADGALLVDGTGPGSLRPDTGARPSIYEYVSPDVPMWEDPVPIELRREHVWPGGGQPADLGGEHAAEVWVGRCWTVARTVEGSLWLWGATSFAVMPGVESSRHTPADDMYRHPVVRGPTRVERLADGEPAPRFVAAAAGEVLGILCLCARDEAGRLYAAGRHSHTLRERLLVPAAGAPPRAPVRQLLAAPEPLALFEDGSVWSVRAARLLALKDVVHIGSVRPNRLELLDQAGEVRFRRRDGRALVVDPGVLWAATWECGA